MLDPTRAGVLRLMNLALGEVEISTLEQEFKHCPNLTYKLLRLVNSVGLGVSAKIHSLRHALVVLANGNCNAGCNCYYSLRALMAWPVSHS